MGHGLSVIAIPAWEFPSWREKLEWHLSSFCERSGGSLTLERLTSDIAEREYQVWAVMDGAEVAACALTTILNDETQTCVITHCAGENHEQWCGELLATIYTWSRSLGSTKLEAVTRPGWERVLARFGMRKTHVVLELKGNG